MVDDGSIVGKKVEFVYETGPNSAYPVYMEFIGYSDYSRYVDYYLTNANTEKYKQTKLFQFSKGEFVNNVLIGEERLKHICVINGDPEWEL